MRWLEGNSMHEIHVSKTSLEIYRYQNAFGNEGIKNALAIVIAKRV
jgi:hypothetical protein